PQARDEMAYCGHRKRCPSAADDQRQRYSDDHPEDTAAHAARIHPFERVRIAIAGLDALQRVTLTMREVNPCHRLAVYRRRPNLVRATGLTLPSLSATGAKASLCL